MRSTMKRLLLVSVALLGLPGLAFAQQPRMLSGWTSSLIQSKKRSILQRLTYFKYPVEISFQLKGQPLTNEKLLDQFHSNDFDADGDWLKDLVIKIKNTS